ncbi:ABC transporter permease [Streptomyces sp. MS06]|uniref:ABC transporter permease n=1 Tax=Streptomyces sp. MS06 TaxID=3385974 RepID=UPI0039A07C81
MRRQRVPAAAGTVGDRDVRRPGGEGNKEEHSMTEAMHPAGSGGAVDAAAQSGAVTTRPEPAAQRSGGLVRHSLVLAGRSMTKIARTPEGLADAIFLPIIFLVMFVYLIGGAVSGSTHDYLETIFPAAMVMTVVMAGMMATGINLNADIKKGVFDRFRSLPIARSAPLIGSVLGDMIRYAVALAALFGFGYAIGFRMHAAGWHALAACLLVAVFAFCFSWGYVLAGVVIREPSGVQGVAILTIFPLAFGTNLLTPTESMPGWVQAWVNINPATHAMDACRGLLLGGAVEQPVLLTLAWSAGALLVFAPLAVRAYRRRT